MKNLEHFQQDPKTFRESIKSRAVILWSWCFETDEKKICENKSGGELGRALSQVFQRGKANLVNIGVWFFDSRVARSAAIILAICLIALVIKSDDEKPFFEVLFDNSESIALTSAGIIFILEIPDRKRRDQNEAWQVINLSQGKSGSGGRIQALEDLNKQGVNLQGVSAPRANLTAINLEKGKLGGSNFRKAILDYAKMSLANLEDSDCQKASLFSVNLEGANLKGANLEGVNLNRSTLNNATLNNVNLKSAEISNANLRKAKIKFSKLQGAFLIESDLQEVDFFGSRLDGARLWKANLRNAKLSQDQADQAKFCRTIMPNGEVNNRDCDEWEKIQKELNEISKPLLDEYFGTR